MSPKKLPYRLQPKKLCRTAPPEGSWVTGEMKLGSLPHLCKELAKQVNSVAKVNIGFFSDESGAYRIEGSIDVTIKLECQRCLSWMDYPLHAKIAVVPIEAEAQLSNVPDDYEPLMLESGEIDLSRWIAEELHLALPLVARHTEPCLDVSEYQTKNT